MKTSNKALFCLLVGGAGYFYSCTKGNSSASTPPPAPAPVINSVSPDSGQLGTTVTISGSGFSANATDNVVKFNDSNAVVSSATATQLTVKVPVSAGTGPVSVTVGGKTATGPVFNYTYIVTVSTVAGTTNGQVDGDTATAQFNALEGGICVDSRGNLYVTEFDFSRIRKITATGVVSTLDGSKPGFADGNPAVAEFSGPLGICVDSQGNLYVADFGNNRIRKITPTGMVNTLTGSSQGFADGSTATALFYGPAGICVDGQGNLYVADEYNHKIRKITTAGMVSTVAGSNQGFADGSATTAQFNEPSGICVDGQGNLYVADTYNHRIRKITPAGMVSTLAGSSFGFADGNGTAARFNLPVGICVDSQGNLYIADSFNNRIRKITPSGIVSTLAGSNPGFADGNPATAQFNWPAGICIDSQGGLYITDYLNYKVRKIGIQ